CAARVAGRVDGGVRRSCARSVGAAIARGRRGAGGVRSVAAAPGGFALAAPPGAGAASAPFAARTNLAESSLARKPNTSARRSRERRERNKELNHGLAT